MSVGQRGGCGIVGLVINSVSTLILFVVVFLWFAGHNLLHGLSDQDKNREHRITARIVITFCWCLSARWRDWYYPRRCWVSIIFEITGQLLLGVNQLLPER
ncbi:hypothetical protein ACLK19_16400 [Escherichia coli]